MCLYGLPRQLETEGTEEGLFEYVARLNGPLPDYHPQMLLQCLLWGRLSLLVFLNGTHFLKHRQARSCQGDSCASLSWRGEET